MVRYVHHGSCWVHKLPRTGSDFVTCRGGSVPRQRQTEWEPIHTSRATWEWQKHLPTQEEWTLLTFPAIFSLTTKIHKQMRMPEKSPSIAIADSIWKDIETTSSVTDEQLSILHFLFGKNFERATRIVDQRGVKRISGTPSGRSFFQVIGESRRKEEYFCFPEHYCACYSFFYDIVNRGEQLCCKHQLAAKLASSLGLYIEVKVSDEELAMLLATL